METSIVLTDSRARQWVYTPEGLRPYHARPLTLLPIVATQTEEPRPSWLTRLWTWLSEAPAHDRW